LKKLFLVPLVVMLLFSLIFGGCTASTASPTTQTATSTETTSALKTLKIGAVLSLSQGSGIQCMKMIEALMEDDNRKGGLAIGDSHYNVKLVTYDSQLSQTAEAAAINRLVYEDKVKFIITASYMADAWLDVTESEKVIAFSNSQAWGTGLKPQRHYSYSVNFLNTGDCAFVGWFLNNYPEAVKPNNVAMALFDNQLGHMMQASTEPIFKAFGAQPTYIFFPEQATDLSAVGTKVVSQNPAFFSSLCGSPEIDGRLANAVHQAGYKGKLFSIATSSALELAQVITPEALEGYICGSLATEFDPPLTQTAKEMKDIWVAKYGKWDGPYYASAYPYYALRTVLQQAGTLDADKVAAVMSNGMKFDVPNGTAQMISRPDVGNDRTIDAMTLYYVKQINKGQPKQIGTVSLDEGYKYFKMAYPPLPPGVTPNPGPPSH
jgi:branched-chain amino acid transport system substrate-binding protein